MRYPDATLSELDATLAKWLTGFVDKDGKKKRREGQKAAQMRVEATQNLDDPNRHSSNALGILIFSLSSGYHHPLLDFLWGIFTPCSLF